MKTRYEELLERGKQRYGDKFDPSDLDPDFVNWYNCQDRIKLAYRPDPTWTVTGTIGVTTGWKPVFLIMRTKRSIGSSDTVMPGRWQVVAYKSGNRYIPCLGARV